VKAYFSWFGSREACTTPNCSGGVSENLNWIFRPDIEYRRSDSIIIGNTNSSAIFNFLGVGYFLDNSIDL
jgi:hypothetical protein